MKGIRWRQVHQIGKCTGTVLTCVAMIWLSHDENGRRTKPIPAAQRNHDTGALPSSGTWDLQGALASHCVCQFHPVTGPHHPVSTTVLEPLPIQPSTRVFRFRYYRLDRIGLNPATYITFDAGSLRFSTSRHAFACTTDTEDS